MSKQLHLDDREKKETQKTKTFTFRLNLFFFAVFIMFSVLIVRLAFMQFVEGSVLEEELRQVATSTIPITPARGNIYDRNGSEIAYSTSTQSAYYRIDLAVGYEELLELAKRLESIFDRFGNGKEPLTLEDIFERMDTKYDLDGSPSSHQVAYSQLRRIKSDLTDKEIAYMMENANKLPGIEITEESVRHYDQERVAVQLIGYLRPYSVAVGGGNTYLNYYSLPGMSDIYIDQETVGYDGLEFMYEEHLRGVDGKKTFPVNALGQIIGQGEIEYPTRGNDLYLTLDRDVQLATQQAIEDHIRFLRTDGRNNPTYRRGSEASTGYAVAMEIDTGNVVSMATYPDYDPDIWNGGRWISAKDYEVNITKLVNGAISQARPFYVTEDGDLDHDKMKRHATSLVPPGSAIKPLTVLIGLQEGFFTSDTIYNDRGIFRFGRDGEVPNASRQVFGRINAADALAVSSNTFMAEMIGNALFMREYERGTPSKEIVDIWDDYMVQFGLGVSTQSGLPMETRGVKDYEDLKSMGSAQSALALSSFGQGGKYTTLQLAQFTAMLANRGKRLKPQFVERIVDPDENIVEAPDPYILNEVDIPDSYWEVIENGMRRVTQHGFDGFSHTFASKTGTSQQNIAGKSVNNAVFIAYAPAENPKLAVAVVVPEGGYGAGGAAPIARKIFDAYDDKMGLY